MRGYIFGLLWLGVLGAMAQEQPQIDIDLQGHTGSIRAMVFSGGHLISAGEDRTIRFWDLRTGESVRTLHPYALTGEGSIYATALSANGRYLAVAGYPVEYGIRIIDLYQDKQIARLLGHTDVVTDLEFSPDGNYLASASADLSAIVWDVRRLDTSPNTREAFITNLKALGQKIQAVAFSQDSRLLAVGGAEGLVRLFTLPETPEKFKDAAVIEVKNLKKHVAPIRGLAFAGQNLLSLSQDGQVCLWTQNGTLSQHFQMGYQASGLAVKGELFVVGGAKTTIFSLKTKTPIGVYEGLPSLGLSVAFGDNYIATAGNDEIHILDKTAKPVLKLAPKGKFPRTVQWIGGLKLAFSSQSKGNFAEGFDFEAMEKITVSQPIRTSAIPITQPYRLANIEVDAKTDGRIRCAVATAQGTIVGCDYSLKLYSPAGKVLREFVGHSGAVFSLSADQRFLASAGADQTIRLWALADSGYLPSPWQKMGELWHDYFRKTNTEKIARQNTRQAWQQLLDALAQTPNFDIAPIKAIAENLVNIVSPVATLIPAADGNWVCHTPKGYYAAAAGGEKYIGWRVNYTADRLAQHEPLYKYRNLLYSPELVKKAISVGSEEMALSKIAPKPDPLEQIAMAKPPIIEWINPIKADTTLKEPVLTVKFRVRSVLELTEVKLMLNGRRIGMARGFRPVSEIAFAGGKEYAFEVDFSQFPGQNYIQVYAKNEMISSLSVAKNIYYSPGDELPDMEQVVYKPNLYLLSVGISEFGNSQYNLNFAHADAESISALFGTQSGKIFGQTSIRQLTNRQATRAQILDGFAWLKSQATPRDVVVVFIASHGFNSNGRFYLLPYDGQADDLERTSVSWADFADLATNLPCRTVVFLDACHSGALGVGLHTDNTEALREMVGDEKGVVIMSASTGKETSLEDEKWGHGAFTLSLIEGMKNGKADLLFSDGLVELRELDTFVFQNVKKLTAGRQTPTTQKPSTISELILYRIQ